MSPETHALPLCLGSIEQFSTLRSALETLDYTEAAICRRTGIESMFNFRTIHEGRETGTEMNDALDALIRLLMDEEALSETKLREFLSADALESMKDLGVVERTEAEPATFYSTVLLYPIDGLYVVSDRTFLPNGADLRDLPVDAVYAAITQNTGRFISMMPRDSCEDLLDLCSGTGIAALLASRGFARRAWAADLGLRSAHFAEFNRRLNGLDNLEAVQGDLYQPVADRTFDRIVAHPPYVPNQSRPLLFRDGGEDGEQILARIVQGLPKHLRPGGSLYCLTAGTDRENESFEQRIRRWLGEAQSEFDVFLMELEFRRSPEEIVQAVTKAKGRLGELGPVSQLFQKLKVTGTYYGVVMVERRATAGPPVTARAERGPHAGVEALEWYRKLSRAAAAPAFLEALGGSQPRISRHMKLLVTHTPGEGGLQASEYLLRSGYPLDTEARIQPWVAALVGSCDGKHVAREIFRELKNQGLISSEMEENEFAGVLRLLVASGFIELSDFPLPTPPMAKR